MSEAGYALQSNRVSLLTRSRGAHRLATASALWAFVLGNAAVLVWLWVHGGNVTNVHSTGELLTSLARITGLLGAYSALLQVLLLARVGPELATADAYVHGCVRDGGRVRPLLDGLPAGLRGDDDPRR